jgi:hypothetical protein
LQRRLLEGIWVAITILATASLNGEVSHFKRKWSMVFFLSFLSVFILLTGGILVALRPSVPVFRPAAEIKAFRYLSQKVTAGQIVLAAYETSNALPAWVPVRTLIGHGPESIHLVDIRPEVERFFLSSTSEQDRVNLIKQNNIAYILYGPAEQALGIWEPDSFTRLSLIYQGENWKIYQVIAMSR